MFLKSFNTIKMSRLLFEQYGLVLMPENFIMNHLETSSRPQYIALFGTTTDTTNDCLKWLKWEHDNNIVNQLNIL